MVVGRSYIIQGTSVVEGNNSIVCSPQGHESLLQLDGEVQSFFLNVHAEFHSHRDVNVRDGKGGKGGKKSSKSSSSKGSSSGSSKSGTKSRGVSVLNDVDEIDISGIRHQGTGRLQSTKTFDHGLVRMARYSRPEFSKTLRCTGSSMDSCHECWDETNCFYGMDNSYQGNLFLQSQGQNPQRKIVVNEFGAQWTRFLNLVHVKCAEDSLEITVITKKVQEGTLRYYWNFLEMTESNGFELGGYLMSPRTYGIATRNYASFAKITSESGFLKGNGNELMIEFTPDPQSTKKRNPTAETRVAMQMFSAFRQCEDTKACLSKLDITLEGSRELRNSNELQRQCLEARSPSKIGSQCREWRECLDDDVEQEILQLLEAAGVGESLSLPHVATDSACIDPLHDDPESWDCDCFETMKQTCENVNHPMTQCMTALMCAHPRVCQSWKSTSKCADVASITQQIQRSSLLERADENKTRQQQSKDSRTDGANFDTSLGLKACG